MLEMVLQVFQTAPSAGFNLFWLAVIWVVTLIAATRTVASAEYILEQ